MPSMASRESNRDSRPVVDFVTLGMLIIDEIHAPAHPVVNNVLGGAGTYAAVGARLLSPPPNSRSVGWIVDAGSDFPQDLRDIIASWETTCHLRETGDRLTTRGLNQYTANEYRAFRYLTPKIRLDHNALSGMLLHSKSFHLICSPTRCLDLIANISDKRQLHSLGQPTWIWEPVPDLCKPGELQTCYESLRHVDVVSPNHEEICAFFGCSAYIDKDEIAKENIERCSADFLASGVGREGHGAVVVRSGKHGCYVATSDRSQWIPSYHLSGSAVMDPTGAGNAFLGGYGVGLVRSKEKDLFKRHVEAASMGTIAASFAIEQIGPPRLSFERGLEMWNEVDVQLRLAEFRKRL